jgi:hypothetical protein
MSSLETMYPSLTTFSDLDWTLVKAEYETDYPELSFPEYLQQKALEGDCPPYLFELAFYELGLEELKSAQARFPVAPGLHLNPTALFLNLEFDVVRMIEEAKAGKVDVIENPHCLCLYKTTQDEVKTATLTEQSLKILELLEDGPLKDKTSLKQTTNLADLIDREIVLELP